MYYVLSGEGRVQVGDASHPVEAGTAVFIPANEWHFAVNTGAEPLRLLYVFAVDRFTDVVYEREEI